MEHHRIHNGTGEPVTVWLEPWGEDYTLLPEEEVTLHPSPVRSKLVLDLIWKPKDLVVYAEGNCKSVAVRQGAQELTCGHNRNHRKDRTW